MKVEVEHARAAEVDYEAAIAAAHWSGYREPERSRMLAAESRRHAAWAAVAAAHGLDRHSRPRTAVEEEIVIRLRQPGVYNA